MLSARERMHPVNTAIGEQKHYEKPKLWFLGKNEAALGTTTPEDSLIHHTELMGEAWFSGCHSGQHTKKCACPRPPTLQTRGSTVARTRTCEMWHMTPVWGSTHELEQGCSAAFSWQPRALSSPHAPCQRASHTVSLSGPFWKLILT